MAHAVAIRAALDEPGPGTLLLEREYFSQSIDTAAFELNNGNGWFDASEGAVHLVAATQSPHEVAEDGARMLAASRFGVKRLVVHPCYTVGYGSKDHCPFPFYALTASLYGDGRPVRLANDRYEQFQSSLKRHSFRIRYRLAVDRDSGKFTIFQGDMTGDGGGRQNFSPSVCLVAATAAQSIYYFPRSDLASTVISSRALDAGSARGYGTLQSMGATEMLVDEAAAELRMDPIELRQRNVFASGMKNTQGAIPAGALRADEVLAKCRQHSLWQQRATRKREYEAAHPGKRYGVGFGCVQKDFGTGAEAAFAEVALARDGQVLLRHVGIDMGTGMATSQAALCVRWLGRPADEVRTGEIEWPELPMFATGNPWLMKQAEQDRPSPQSALDAVPGNAEQRQQFGVLLRPCDARGRAVDFHARLVARGAGNLGCGFRRRSARTAGGAARGRALGRWQTHRGQPGRVATRATGGEGIRAWSRDRRDRAHLQSLAMGGSRVPALG